MPNTKIARRVLVAAFASLLPLSTVATATEDPSAISVQLETAAEVHKGRRAGASEVRADLDDYLARHGLMEGPQIRGDSRVTVMIEIVRTTRLPGERAFHTARSTAYQRAYLSALGKFISQRAQVIENQLGSVIADNSDNLQLLNEICAPSRADAVTAKLEQLAEALVDNALQELDAAPSPSAAAPRIDCPAAQNLFRSRTSRRAAEALSGLRVVFSSEVGGQVGIVLVHSSNFEKAARTLLHDQGTRWPAGDPLGELRTQLKDVLDNEVLRGTFGTRLLTASNGEPVIVAFGQSGPDLVASDSDLVYDRKFETARRIAYNEAAAELARFARAMAVLTSEDSQVDEWERKVDLQSGEYSEPEVVAETLLETVETRSSLSVQGIAEVHSWEIESDANGQALVGVVLAWSPSLRSTFGRDASPPAANAPGRAGTKQAAEHRARGAEVKEDW
ncbi:MAG: hypothetical protein IT475_17085 [Aquimonas sp.]|nr:hypothetical protein [Aquimonas sp.]